MPADRDAESFEVFFAAQHVKLFGTLCLVTGNRSEAEELMQEAFLKVWERWPEVSATDDPPGYLYRTAFNLFRNRYRRAVLAAKRLTHSTPAEDAFDRIDARDSLVRALRALSPRQRAAIVLTEILDLTSEEAADALGVKPATVRVLSSQARATLKRSLEQANE